MSLKPREEIGAEVHTLDQFFRVEEGDRRSRPRRRSDGDSRRASRSSFPQGANHNIVNTGNAFR